MAKKINRRNRPIELNDQTPEMGPPQKTGTVPVAQIRSVASPVLHFFSLSSSRTGQRTRFLPPEYDLVEIGRVADVESYVRQAFKKKTALLMKEGQDYVGANPRTIRYIKTRFAQIARASRIPHDELLRRVGTYLIRASNAFLVKVRDKEASGGRIRVDINDKEVAPVAAYFPIPPETMEVSVDNMGKVLRWKQKLPNGQYKEFRPEDVVHFHFDRKEGFIFGTPTLVPVLDDIRALRRIEENIELLVYKHLFPLFQYVVGTEDAPAGYTEKGTREIDEVRAELEIMPLEGGIVTPERHKIQAIGAEGRALRAESYLDHFKRRVFAGLAMSAVDYGEGDTSNRSTSDNMSLAQVDDVKDFQAVLECQWNELIIKELLEESAFGPEVLEEANLVNLKFREIDIDKQVKIENHAVDLFTKHGLTWDELRHTIGRQPIEVPEDPENQDPASAPQWFNTFWKLFHEPELMIRAVDEPFSSAAQAAVESRSIALTQKTLLVTQKAEIQKREQQARAQAQARRPKDNFLLSKYRDLENDLILEASSPNGSPNMSRAIIQAAAKLMTDDLKTRMGLAFNTGLGVHWQRHPRYFQETIMARKTIEIRAHKWSERLHRDIDRLLTKRIDSDSPDARISNVRAIFGSLAYRTDFIADVEIRKANMWGKVVAAKLSGAVALQYQNDKGSCEACQHLASLKPQYFNAIDIEDIVPHHAACRCKMTYLRPEDIKDSETIVTETVEDAVDPAKLERCVLRVKQQLARKGQTGKAAKSKALAICTASLQGKIRRN